MEFTNSNSRTFQKISQKIHGNSHKTPHLQKSKIGKGRGWFVPILTHYSYIYTVNGREYRYSAERQFSERHLMPKAPMIYVKGFPRHAYHYKFKGTKEWTIGLTMLFVGAFWLFVIIYFLNI